VGQELVWEEESVNLRRGKQAPADSTTAGDAPPRAPEAEALPQSALWRLPGDLGRRYAAVSGDHNPIHIHPLTAKLFGFPSAIAHGMWTKARCLAALENRLPPAYTVEVGFRRPILLPGKVAFGERSPTDAPGEIEFGVRAVGRDGTHLVGKARPAS
jgi:acyl dehydratase